MKIFILLTSFIALNSFACGGATSFRDATSVACVLTNLNNQSEKNVTKALEDSEGGTSVSLFATGSYSVEASSYSIGACNEGDFLFVKDKKSGSSFSTKSGEISFRSADGKVGYSISCIFKR